MVIASFMCPQFLSKPCNAGTLRSVRYVADSPSSFQTAGITPNPCDISLPPLASLSPTDQHSTCYITPPPIAIPVPPVHSSPPFTLSHSPKNVQNVSGAQFDNVRLSRIRPALDLLRQKCVVCWAKGAECYRHFLGSCPHSIANGRDPAWVDFRCSINFPDRGVCYGCGVPLPVRSPHLDNHGL